MAGTRKKRILYTVLSLVFLAALVAGGLGLHQRRLEQLKQVAPPEKFPWALRTTVVSKRDLTEGFPVLATLSSQSEIVIIPQISGVIRKMGPREGQVVNKGQLLFELDTQELDNQLSALEASYQAAKGEAALKVKELKRKETLLPKGFASQDVVDQLRTALQTANERVKQIAGEIDALKTRLTYGLVRSPMDGIIAARLQDPGDLAAPGRPVYRITAVTGAKVKVTVPQRVAARMHEGSLIKLSLADQSQTVTVTRVFPSLDALSMGNAEADLDKIPFALPSGARVNGRVILKQWPRALVVPRTAISLAPDGKTGTVFKIVDQQDDGLAKLQSARVTVIASGQEGIAINGAVSAGDVVVIAQETELLKLKDGDPVTLQFGQGK